jgi:hypothetical protein
MLPGGSEERIMTNLSLARIMYGTSEDLHASTTTTASALATQSSGLLDENSPKSSDEPDTLAELLHKAWTNLSGKH